MENETPHKYPRVRGTRHHHAAGKKIVRSLLPSHGKAPPLFHNIAQRLHNIRIRLLLLPLHAPGRQGTGHNPCWCKSKITHRPRDRDRASRGAWPCTAGPRPTSAAARSSGQSPSGLRCPRRLHRAPVRRETNGKARTHIPAPEEKRVGGGGEEFRRPGLPDLDACI